MIKNYLLIGVAVGIMLGTSVVESKESLIHQLKTEGSFFSTALMAGSFLQPYIAFSPRFALLCATVGCAGEWYGNRFLEKNKNTPNANNTKQRVYGGWLLKGCAWIASTIAFNGAYNYLLKHQLVNKGSIFT